MKEFAKYIGVVVMLIGVAIMVIPFLIGNTGNSSLIWGMVLVVNGLLGYIYVNNMKKGSMVSNILWGIILLVVPFFLYVFAKKQAYSQEEIEAYN
jgi:uncharacterized membrane protein HdeD (DUF308 family)